jgi:hypothetical protein
MLARVHGQRGCASITSVDFSADRRIADAEGQVAETEPTRPGVLSYLNKIWAPKATAATQVTPSKPVTKIFLCIAVAIPGGAAAVMKQ